MESRRHRPRKKRYKPRRAKFATMFHEKSDEVVGVMMGRQENRTGAKDLFFNDVCVRR